ncbi:MAG: tryptophan--tRNA ligase [Bacteroidia bacterium]|nr:tryptophan--tRNA ligase [Bacteroidia bacterium]MCX7652409.1 tryptophan--tRNA ligase [Bacteroidia bacterium]MDW8417358.1 tryptophan--tRNA ligase [Bacteroidia bacterium]
MSRVLTGIQSSGKPHLGNLLGAILPAIELAEKQSEPAYLFIADLHALTVIRDAETLRENTYAVAATWLAAGLDPEKHVFFRQSDVPEVCELAWYLGCLTPYPMLANAHSFKEKSGHLAEVSAGLFTYPVLMAADILLYQTDLVPVGKDQKQHLEITRDIAGAFNRAYGEVFKLPEGIYREEVMILPGIDGRKMSKSYGNTLDPLGDLNELYKRVKRIVTDAKPLDAPKDPENCTIFKLYSVVAPPEAVENMRERYLSGGYGYGQAKEALYEALVQRFSAEREAYHRWISDKPALEAILQKGAEKARAEAHKTLSRVRQKVGVQGALSSIFS